MLPPSLVIPLEVFGIGIIISYGIAVLIKLLLSCIRKVTKSSTQDQ